MSGARVRDGQMIVAKNCDYKDEILTEE